MEKASRKPKNVSIDRLSLLPDDVICHILRFLPTKISVSTSILGRRWRSLWVHVPDLDFSDHLNYLKQMRYSDMVSSVMSQRQAQTINTFRLRFSYVNDVQSSELKAWIENAISRNVGCVDLSLPYMHPTPRKLFTCETLVSLKLDSCFIGGDTVSLPNLKKLHLYYVSCEDDITITRLLSGCPVLEELIISDVYGSGERLCCWNISSPKINRLTLKIPPQHKVVVFAPALGYLQIYNCSYRNISLCHLSSLVKAHIHFNSNFVEGDNDNPIHLFDFLNQISNVQHLKLSGVNNLVEFILRVWFKDTGSSYPILKFYNLTNLDTDGGWCFLAKLLGCAYNLQELIIRESYWGATNNDLKIWTETFEGWPACLRSLGSVTFDKFGCREAEFEMVRYLMRNAKVLKRMKIVFYRGNVCAEKRYDAMKRILSLEKGQGACELVFY